MSSNTFVVLNCRVRSILLSTFPSADKYLDYFTKILEDDLKAIVKPQYVDRIPKAIRSADKTVRTLIEGSASMDNLTEVLDVLGKYTAPCKYCCRITD